MTFKPKNRKELKKALNEYFLKNEQKYGNINKLDGAKIDVKNEKLFEYILDFPIISTSTNESKNGYWTKISDDKYIFFTRKNQYEFLLKDGQFLCVSSEKLCEDIF